MSVMVERVAIALYQKDEAMLAMYKTGAESWPHDREGMREEYRAKARVAITAMRDLTPAMLSAGLGLTLPKSWPAMIDEALR